MALKDELACVYSSLILQDDNVPVTAEKINSLLKEASVDVEPFWPGIFAKAVETLNLRDLISNVGSGAGSAPAEAGVGTLAAPTEEKKEDKKEDEEEEEDDDMGFGLFD